MHTHTLTIKMLADEGDESVEIEVIAALLLKPI